MTPPESQLREAAAALAGRRVVALTGAGISTDSGIPDYRGPGSPARRPMTYAQFRSGDEARRRYWARSHVGWSRIAGARPNGAHRALAELERAGAVAVVITQNVDGLHDAAGSREVVDLHGRLADVICLDCATRSPRRRLHERLVALNPAFDATAAAAVAPDGDAELASAAGFVVAPCDACGGVLKPDIVFFGENVPKARVAHCYALVDSAQALVVAGSSLTVMSGLRFVHRAAALGQQIVIVNRGATRGDALATVRIDAGCGPALERLTQVLAGARQPACADG